MGPAGEPPAPAAEIDLSNPAATGGGENQTLVGYGPRTASLQRRARRGGASPATDAGAAAQLHLQGAFGQGVPEASDVAEVAGADEPAAPAARAASAAPAPLRPPGPGDGADVRVLAKPPVRKLAKDLGVDLRTLAPSGPDGTVTREDVHAASAAAATEVPDLQVAAAPSPAGTSARETRGAGQGRASDDGAGDGGLGVQRAARHRVGHGRRQPHDEAGRAAAGPPGASAT